VLKDYEILFIVRPDLDDDHLTEAVKSVETLISNLGGKIKRTDVWGRRKLAFEVKHLREGQYVLTDFEIDPQTVPELESTLKISDTVFRYLVVRKPERRRKEVGLKSGQPEPATVDEGQAPQVPEDEAAAG
jgi:small subunit ribosomal protein S6